MWRCSFFTSLLFTSTPVPSFRFIDLDLAAAVFVPVAYFFDTYFLYDSILMFNFLLFLLCKLERGLQKQKRLNPYTGQHGPVSLGRRSMGFGRNTQTRLTSTLRRRAFRMALSSLGMILGKSNWSGSLASKKVSWLSFLISHLATTMYHVFI